MHCYICTAFTEIEIKDKVILNRIEFKCAFTDRTQYEEMQKRVDQYGILQDYEVHGKEPDLIS